MELTFGQALIFSREGTGNQFQSIVQRLYFLSVVDPFVRTLLTAVCRTCDSLWRRYSSFLSRVECVCDEINKYLFSTRAWRLGRMNKGCAVRCGTDVHNQLIVSERNGETLNSRSMHCMFTPRAQALAVHLMLTLFMFCTVLQFVN